MSTLWRIINKINIFHLHSHYKFDTGHNRNSDVRIELCDGKRCNNFKVKIQNLKQKDEILIKTIENLKNQLQKEKYEYYANKQRKAWITKEGLK